MAVLLGLTGCEDEDAGQNPPGNDSAVTDVGAAEATVSEVTMSDAAASEVAPPDAGPVDGPSDTSDTTEQDSTPPAPLLINGCTTFVDRTAAGDSRTLPWDNPLGSNPARCMQIRSGQSVTWVGDFNPHPLGPHGGTVPSPIAGRSNGTESYEVTFAAPGTFGYLCGDHPEMIGAIYVVP